MPRKCANHIYIKLTVWELLEKTIGVGIGETEEKQ